MTRRPPTTVKSFVSRILDISPLSDVFCGEFPANAMIPIGRCEGGKGGGVPQASHLPELSRVAD